MPAKGAADFVPDTHDLAELSTAAQSCKGCDLYLNATQTVFGEGSAGADIMIVGEQPGDQEDRAGAPFVGPAGKLLDKALAPPTSTGPALRHQRGEALQIHPSRAWQTPNPQDTQPQRGGGLPTVAVRRNDVGAARRGYASGRNSRKVVDGQ